MCREGHVCVWKFGWSKSFWISKANSKNRITQIHISNRMLWEKCSNSLSCPFSYEDSQKLSWNFLTYLEKRTKITKLVIINLES